MQLSVPRSSSGDVQESDLQKNNPECLISSNSTHLLVEIPLNGCGTRVKVLPEHSAGCLQWSDICAHHGLVAWGEERLDGIQK